MVVVAVCGFVTLMGNALEKNLKTITEGRIKMKKEFKKIIAGLLAAVLLVSTASLGNFKFKASASEITEYKTGDIITFGSYPQSEVTDEELIAALNLCEGEWVSYNYYSGTGIWDDGKMAPSDFMRYKDVEYENDKYRAVTFDSYRAYLIGYKNTAINSFQDKNGYHPNNVYWFKFEPLEWQVLDPATGYVLAKKIVDAQPFSNYVLYSGTDAYGNFAMWGNSEKTYHTNNYAYSTIRDFLISTFYNTAFTQEQQDAIAYTVLDNSAWSANYSAYDAPTTTDKIYLPSHADMHNTDYGFEIIFDSGRGGRVAISTQYAKCQGMDENHWWLRSAGQDNDYPCYVSRNGRLFSEHITAGQIIGIRPAMNFVLDADIFPDVENEEPTTEEPTTEEPTTEEPSTQTPNIELEIKTPSTNVVTYGDTLVLQAVTNTNLPDGYTLEWTVTGNGAHISPATDTLTCSVSCISDKTAEVTVMVKLVKQTDEDGEKTEPVLNAEGEEIRAEQKLTMKSNIFWKIISFFKNIFTISRIILESV